jgi:hypothetical protein
MRVLAILEHALLTLPKFPNWHNARFIPRIIVAIAKQPARRHYNQKSSA